MKRLLIIVFLISSIALNAIDVTPEQEKLAWKFINEYLLSDKSQNMDCRPNIFKEDVNVNIKGKITSTDSIYVKKLLSEIQSEIPHLKLKLTDSPGNLGSFQ